MLQVQPRTAPVYPSLAAKAQARRTIPATQSAPGLAAPRFNSHSQRPHGALCQALSRPQSHSRPANVRVQDRARTQPMGGDMLVGDYLTERRLRDLCAEVIHDVREATGWAVTMPRVELQRRCEVGHMLRDSSDPGPTLTTQIHTALAIGTIMFNAMGLYNPYENKLIVVAENVRTMNFDYLRSVLHHELVHAAQNQNFPQFAAQEAAAREAMAGPPSLAREQAARLLFCSQRLVEGHARLLEKRSRVTYYPKAAWDRSPPFTPWFLKPAIEATLDEQFKKGPYSGCDVLEALEKGGTRLDPLLRRLFRDPGALVNTFAPTQK